MRVASTSMLEYVPEMAWVRKGNPLMRTDGSSTSPNCPRICRETADSASAAEPKSAATARPTSTSRMMISRRMPPPRRRP